MYLHPILFLFAKIVTILLNPIFVKVENNVQNTIYKMILNVNKKKLPPKLSLAI